ncbi:universal stress protein [Streptomyces specialis]|uniref:universal stress protein n=1 Tax=Streptomyces specialis TaxID=498367 RepID=UPI000AA88E27|nr:universal stress protein [Streptomyces specialis]
MFPTVTVGLDGSSESLAAAGWAAGEARRRGLPLRLVHVWEAGAYSALPSVDGRTLRYWAERIPREAAEDLRSRFPGVDISYEQFTGAPARVLTGETAEGSGMLVLGTRGLGGLTGFLLGSVAQSAVAHAHGPVALVRPGADGEAAAPAATDVVLGLDVADPPAALIDHAFDAAARRGARLRVVHAWRVPPVYGFSAATVEPGIAAVFAEDVARELADALRPWRAKYPGVEVVEQPVMGRPGRELAEAARDAAVLIVGRRARRARTGWHIGPVTHAVMHHAIAPVIVVPHP